MAREKNLLPQLRCPRGRAFFDIPFAMESGMPKIFLPFDHDKRLCMYEILYKIKLDLTVGSGFHIWKYLFHVLFVIVCIVLNREHLLLQISKRSYFILEEERNLSP